MFEHSCQLSNRREENKTDHQLPASPQSNRRVGIGGSYNTRRSLKVLLLSCQRKTSAFEHTYHLETEISQEGNQTTMALKRSSSVPNKVSYPLHDAVHNADIKELGKLFKKKRRIDIDLKDQEGFSPLHRAAQLGLTEAVQLLVSHGANVNLKDKSNVNPLYYAVQSGNFECASFLIEQGADDNDIKDGFIDSKMPELKGSSYKFSRSRMSVHN